MILLLGIAIHEAHTTLDKFIAYGVIHIIRCHLCGGDEEDIDYLLFDCPFISIFSMIYAPNAPFHFGVVLGLAPFIGSLSSV